MTELPKWAKKPRHRKELEATNRGWVVKDTREVLKVIKGLADRIDELNHQDDKPEEELKPEVEQEAKPKPKEKSKPVTKAKDTKKKPAKEKDTKKKPTKKDDKK